MDLFTFAIGVVLVVLTGLSVLFTMVLPRSPRGFERLLLQVNRIVRVMFLGFARFFRSYETKDLILAPVGPVALVAQLVLWAGFLIVGFGLMLYSTTHSLPDALLQASSALFTVGAFAAGGHANAAIDIAAGSIWVIIVALQIAYLPALYGAFNRREALVSLLESRAGVPAWGPEVLARHQLVGITDTLPALYGDWEVWSAELAETHTTYPVLLLFRSPEPWFSWLIGLLAVLDGAAMHVALDPKAATSQARLFLRMGFTALNRIAEMLGWEVDLDPNPNGPIELKYEEFEGAVDMLREIGFAMTRTAQEAWPDFVGWRVNYEQVAYRLADRVTAPPAPWSGQRSHLRSAPVAPRRPPQRAPGDFQSDAHRLSNIASAVRRRRGSTLPDSDAGPSSEAGPSSDRGSDAPDRREDGTPGSVRGPFDPI